VSAHRKRGNQRSGRQVNRPRVGNTTTTGSNSGRAVPEGFSEAMIPIMERRPNAVHSKENIALPAAQMLRSLPTGHCVINYVGTQVSKRRWLKIPYRPSATLSDEAFAKLRTKIFERSRRRCPQAKQNCI